MISEWYVSMAVTVIWTSTWRVTMEQIIRMAGSRMMACIRMPFINLCGSVGKLVKGVDGYGKMSLNEGNSC